MNPLSALTSAYSLFQGIGQQRAARENLRKASRYGDQELGLARDGYFQAQDTDQHLRSIGMADPTAQLKEFEDSFKAGLRLSEGNHVRALASAGVRPGDSVLADDTTAERALAAYNMSQGRRQILDKTYRETAELQAMLQNARGAYGNALDRSASQLRADAAAYPGDVGSAIAGFGSINPRAFRKWPKPAGKS